MHYICLLITTNRFEAMTKCRILFILLILFVLQPVVAGAQILIINEIQTRNTSTASDSDGDFEEWLEILNTSSESVNADGYGLSDDDSDYFKWVFPSIELGPGELIVVWLSGKNRTNVDGELHVNFSLKENETVFLVSPSLTDFNDLSTVYLPKDASYGRSIDMSELVYFNIPTIGFPNISSPSYGVAPPPTFSHSGGFYPDDFQLSISTCSDCNTVYTLDGSEPNLNNLEPTSFLYKNSYLYELGDEFGPFLEDSIRSFLYVGNIQVVDRSADPDRISQKSSTQDFSPQYLPDTPSFKGTPVRARSFAQGLLPSETITEVYFITSEGSNRYNLPVLSLVLGEKELFGYEKGIHTAGATMDAWRTNNPDLYPPPVNASNFGRRGMAWERCARLDIFDKETGKAFISQDIGVRIHGASSRRFPRKSFRLYAREKYGRDDFQSQIFKGYPGDSFERFLLRNSGGDERFTNFRDPMIHRFAEPMEAVTNPATAVYMFVNGEFYGLNNLREYFDDNYFLKNYGIEREDLDLIRGVEVELSSGKRYEEVSQLCEKGGFESPEVMTVFEDMVDMPSFRDVFVTNVISNNSDMLPKNILWYRNNAPTGTESDLFYSALVDQDKGWGHPQAGRFSSHSFNSIDYYLNEEELPLTPYLTCFKAAMQNVNFERNYINRTADVLNTFFRPERTIPIINEIQSTYEPHYKEHIDRWSGYNENVESVDEWLAYIQEMKDFSQERPDSLRKNIVDLFEFEGLFELVLDVSDSTHGYIHLNTIDIRSSTEGIDQVVYPWSGIYFFNLPIDLEAIPSEGFLFSHWEGDISDTLSKVTTSFNTEFVELKAVFIEDTTQANGYEDEVIVKPFPNPNDGGFNLLVWSDSEVKNIRIYDALGREIRADITRPGADTEWQINTDCSAGIYFLEVLFANGERRNSRIVVYD